MSHLTAPIELTLSQEKREGPSERFESVGTLAYHGVICFALSSTSVAVRIFFAIQFRVSQKKPGVTHTIVVSINHNCIGDYITPKPKRAKENEKIAFIDR